jgi:DNA polymerase III alpha subunit
MSFVGLHIHSDYSMLDGASQLNDLVTRAVELGMPAIALFASRQNSAFTRDNDRTY